MFAEQHAEHGNPLLNPDVCQAFVEACHRRHGTDFTYGGWMEVRNTLWRGSYLDDDARYVHLGTDFNVPAGTGVTVPCASVVLRIDNDYPDTFGWGNRVIVHDEQKDIVMVFAHLESPTGITVGDVVMPGSIFARVGTSEHNGGWFPHLHVQMLQPDVYRTLLKDDLRDLDGYGRVEEIDRLRAHFPDPMLYVEV